MNLPTPSPPPSSPTASLTLTVSHRAERRRNCTLSDGDKASTTEEGAIAPRAQRTRANEIAAKAERNAPGACGVMSLVGRSPVALTWMARLSVSAASCGASQASACAPRRRRVHRLRLRSDQTTACEGRACRPCRGERPPRCERPAGSPGIVAGRAPVSLRESSRASHVHRPSGKLRASSRGDDYSPKTILSRSRNHISNDGLSASAALGSGALPPTTTAALIARRAPRL